VGEFDVNLRAVIEHLARPPWRRVTLDAVAKPQFAEIEAAVDRRRRIGGFVLAAQRDQLVLWILPGHRGHIGLLGRAQLHQIGAPIGVDHEIGREIRPRRLGQDMNALGRPGAALGVADHPAHGVAGGDRT
jgi:hypothetical protein